MKNKLLIIIGPTASGKTKLALDLAKKFSGEILCCDSRQVYQNMDIVTGKDLELIEKSQIPVYGLDLVKPDQLFSAAHFVTYAQKVIKSIWQKNKLPIITTGTGFWLKALLEGMDSLGIPPQPQLRKRLGDLSLNKLQKKLIEINPVRWQKMNQSDQRNPCRLIRAIEIYKNNKTKLKSGFSGFKNADIFKIGLKTENKFLYSQVNKRVNKRVKHGALKETEKLAEKYAWDLPSMSGIGYGELKDYLLGKINLDQVITNWQNSEHTYVRRQKTWFKKDPSIVWFDIQKPGFLKNIVKRIKSWYDNNYEAED